MTTPSPAQSIVEMLRERAQALKALREDPTRVEHWQYRLEEAQKSQLAQAGDIIVALEGSLGTQGVLSMFTADELALALHAELIGDEDDISAEFALNDIADYVHARQDLVLTTETELNNLAELVQRALAQKDAESTQFVLNELANRIDDLRGIKDESQ